MHTALTGQGRVRITRYSNSNDITACRTNVLFSISVMSLLLYFLGMLYYTYLSFLSRGGGFVRTKNL